MREMWLPFLGWYLVVQIVTLAALPLTLRLFPNLPDRGYAFAKSLGVLLVGFFLWLGVSYQWVMNDTGGAWLAVLVVAVLSAVAGWPFFRQPSRTPHPAPRFTSFLPSRRYILFVELLFLLAFAAWTWVRAHDPAINHTEQPMDLMFMNGIWTSRTYPPQDPWMAGYAISYYYFGYWLVITLARLAGQTPEVAYNLGQAGWFGLLLLGSFGVGYNLMARALQGKGRTANGKNESDVPITLSSLAAGLLSAVAVGLTGNLQVILEWLYAQGVNVDALARLVDVYNFPEQAVVSKRWFIDAGWTWWWRASRVLEDTDLMGNHIEVIDEFPIFSYVLGDNHPHVLAMPFVLLAVGLALNLFCSSPQDPISHARYRLAQGWQTLRTLVPRGVPGLFLLVVATGGLLFLNTWDFPPYWLLMTLAALWAAARIRGIAGGMGTAGLLAGILLMGTLVVFFPYFLSAQSQAGGVVPNLFNPTHLPQFLLMFGHFLLAVTGLLLLAWREQPPRARTLLVAGLLVWGLPLIFLALSVFLATNTDAGQDLLTRMPLPPGETSYTAVILRRWLAQPWTFLLTGGLTAATGALLWERLMRDARAAYTTTFALLLAGIGLLLAYAPEFVYLRDNFGSRMNTVFKFYYQSWLLLGLASSYTVVLVLGRRPALAVRPEFAFSTAALLLILAGLIYPVAGAYAKVTGFGVADPTLNGIAYLSPAQQGAIEWIRRNTEPDAVVLQGKGLSYRADSAIISAATGRPTLLGWDGHEAQWRGRSYGEMAAGRAEAADEVYRRADPVTLPGVLDRWGIDYVVVGPTERSQYGITPEIEARLARVMQPVFEQDDVRIYRRASRRAEGGQ